MAQHAPWVELSKAQHVQTMMSETFDHARAAALAAREIDARVVTQVEHPSQLASVAYHAQATTLNTLQAWEQRLAPGVPDVYAGTPRLVTTALQTLCTKATAQQMARPPCLTRWHTRRSTCGSAMP